MKNITKTILVVFLFPLLGISQELRGSRYDGLQPQGNGTKVQLSTGSTTTNDCVKFDANGNTVDSGGACGGSGTPGGSNGQLQFNNSGAFGGFTLGGDCTFSQPNITCTKTNGVAFKTYSTGTTTSSATISPGTANFIFYSVTAQAAAITTVNAPGGSPAAGDWLFLTIKDDGTPRAISGWNAIYVASSDLAFPTTTTAGKILTMIFVYNPINSKYVLQAVLDNI